MMHIKYCFLFPFSPWHVIQEVIGDKVLWPSYVLDGFWKCPLNYHWRLVICAFSYGNGLSVDLLLNFLKKYRAREINGFRERKIRDLYRYWDHETLGHERRSRRSHYNIAWREVLDLNGGEVLVENGGVVERHVC